MRGIAPGNFVLILICKNVWFFFGDAMEKGGGGLGGINYNFVCLKERGGGSEAYSFLI